jgi:hypothetical protein
MMIATDAAKIGRSMKKFTMEISSPQKCCRSAVPRLPCA